MKCSTCNQDGHNKRSCKTITTEVSAPKREAETEGKVGPTIDDQILEDIKLKLLASENEHIALLRLKNPKLSHLTDDEIKQLCNNINSHFQSQRCKNGGIFEKCVEEILSNKGILFQRQVLVDKDGRVADTKVNNKIVDIVIGNPVVGDHISNYTVISLKTSTRERSSEDDWTKVHKPKLYIYGTLKSDYPSPEKFEESEFRKLMCVVPKEHDTRKFKLRFNDLIDLILG
jgi:hypothetical protein